jgi:hypothetical protein
LQSISIDEKLRIANILPGQGDAGDDAPASCVFRSVNYDLGFDFTEMPQGAGVNEVEVAALKNQVRVGVVPPVAYNGPVLDDDPRIRLRLIRSSGPMLPE